MTSDFSRALAVLAEALVSGRRVLVVGDSSLGLHDVLAELGARMVHVYDPDASRAMAQPAPDARGTVLRGMPEGDFEVRDGAFDLAIVPDVATMDDAPALLARLRRVVGSEGAVLCGAANKDATGASTRALDYYELFDLVSLQFATIRMIAAMPFFGVTMAELGQDEVDAAVRVDTQLAGDRASPTAFLALASQSDVALDAYSVIELPAPSRSEPSRATQESAVALAQAKLRADVLEAQVGELAEARSARARVEEDARRLGQALDVERERASRLERDLDALASTKVAQTQPAPQNDELAEELAQTQIRAAALEEGVELAEKTIVVQRERITELEAALAQADENAATLAREVAPPSITIDATEEVAALEEKLRERAETVLALEAELARREKIVRELVARLEAGPSAGGGGDLERKLDELAMLAAHQKSELEARAWRITELERAAAGRAPPTHTEASPHV